MHARTLPALTVRTLSCCLGIAAAIGSVDAALGANSFTLTSGSATFSLNNLQSPRTGTNNGLGSFTTGSPTTNHMYQNWFWLSTGTDTREYALSNQTSEGTIGSNTEFLEYTEPTNNGAVASAVKIQLQYSLQDLNIGSGRSDEAILTIAYQITNLTSANLNNIHLYHYADFDAAGSGPGDSIVVRGTEHDLQVISDPGSGGQLPSRIDYAAGSALHVDYQVAQYPTIRDRLTNATLDGISGAATTVSGDCTGANHWYVPALGPAGFGQDSFCGSITIHIISRCKADFNESGAIEVQDIFDYLGAWFAGCP